jgi:hypothetical protein
MRLINLAVAAATAAVAASTSAQTMLDAPQGQMIPYQQDSGMLANAQDKTVILFKETVHIKEAVWLRVYFGEVELAPGSFVRITSQLDGEVQELDTAGMTMWGNSSAYFNGDTVIVELVAGAGSAENRVVINEVAAQIGAGIALGDPGECGICGTDDRVPSDFDYTARLWPSGCTASIFSENSCVLTAGHCVGGNMVLQFRVPNSTSGCQPVSPPVIEQFPATTVDYNNGGPGNDWGVLEAGLNNAGETPFERYGELRPISTQVAGQGQSCELAGYGADNTCVLTFTQQWDDGYICAVYSNAYEFYVDLRGGNSGSALLRNHQIIGIATHCPCCNVATRVDRPDLADAIEECTPLVPSPIATGPNSGDDGYLALSPDGYGSWWAPWAEAGDFEDLFNPAGSHDALRVARTSGFFLFVDGTQRELLSDSEMWQSYYGEDSTLEREVVSERQTSDTDGDGVDDRVISSFSVWGTGTNLSFNLTQDVDEVIAGEVSSITQRYSITNVSGTAIDFELVRSFDGRMIWVSDHENDSVGTTTNGSLMERFVFMQEPGESLTAVTVSSDSGTAYFGGKNGVDPDGAGGSPPYNFGTDTDIWNAYGIPTGWRNNIAGVGYDTDGQSGPAPPGSNPPEDGFIGLEIPVSLGPGASTVVTINFTYGAATPFGEGSETCPEDCDGSSDGLVDILDFLEVLAQWGEIGGTCDMGLGDPGVGINEFLAVLGQWGACP